MPNIIKIFALAAVTTIAVVAQQKTWRHRDLTAVTGARVLEHELDGFAVGPGGADPRLYYSDYPGGRVWELAYYQGGWHSRDLTAATGTPIATTQPMAGFREGDASSRVYYVGAGWHVYELAYSQQNWSYRDITAESGAPPRDANVNGNMVAFQVAGTDPRVYYVNADRHVHELAYYQGGWRHSDITARTGAPPVDTFGNWTAFPVAGTDPRIYYMADGEGTQGRHIYELAYYQGGWRHRNLTTSPRARLADWASDLAGFAVGPGRTDPRVYYIKSGSSDLVELAYYQGDWHITEIIQATGAPEHTFELAGFAVNGTDNRVYSTASDGHIREFSYSQDRWRIRDLTADTGAPLHHTGVSRLVAFAVAGTDPRVYYSDKDERVHELAYYQDGSGDGDEPATRTVVLNRQPGEPPVPYEGRFPAIGVVPSGRLVQIRVPQIGPMDFSFKFVKAGRSTQDCNDPGAVVEVAEGQSTTPEQISAIFGASEPGFSTVNPVVFRACVGSDAGELPNWRDIEITVRFD